MGVYRGGKSFFLNFVVRYLKALESSSYPLSSQLERSIQNTPYGSIPKWMTAEGEFVDGFRKKDGHQVSSGFSVSSGTERNTTGILFWNRPFVVERNNERICVLIMDTQGLWDPETGNELNTCIFGLSAVLSSYLIFNTKGTLDCEQFKQLARLSEFSKGITEGNEKGFQHLHLLCRDYTEFDADGDVFENAINGIQEWKKKLKMKPAFKDSYATVSDCFEEFDVFCLPRPGDIDDIGYDGSLKNIKPLFMQMLGFYIEQIVKTIQPRRINGRIVTCEMFKE